MNIPDKAMQAAEDVAMPLAGMKMSASFIAYKAVEAAAPIIAAQALRRASETVRERITHQIPEDVTPDSYEEGFRHGLNQGYIAATLLDFQSRDLEAPDAR